MSTQFQSASGTLAPIPETEVTDQLAQERAEEQANFPKLTLFLNRTLDAIASLDQNENLKIHNEQIRCVAYYDGRFDGYVRNGVWVDNAPIPGEILGRDNEFKRQIDKLLMEMARGRIEQECTAVEKFSAAKREAAQFAKRRAEVNQERIETEPFVQGENQSLLLKTVAYRYTFFDRSAESREQMIELSVVRSMAGESKSLAVCRTCGMSATGVTCPHCGDTETKTIESPALERADTKQKKKSAGRAVTVRPDATMVQLDLNARDVPSSSFIRWRLTMRRCDWEAMYPKIRIPSSDESIEARHRAESQNQPSNSDYWASSDDAGGDQFEKIEGELVWLDAKVYQRYRNKENERLRGGQILTQGSELTKQFPGGLCIARIGQTILDLYPSNKNKCWTMCVYGLREHALHGSGTTALLGPQETLVELNSAIQANIVYNAGGRDLVRSGAIEGGQLPPVDKVAFVNCQDDSVSDIAKWAMGKISPSPLSSEVYAYRQEMQGSLQDAAGTFSLSNQGAADMKALGTATAVEASRDSAVGRMIPNRKLQGYMGSEWLRQVLQLERENYSPEVFLASAGKGDEKGEIEFTERGVRTFFEMDAATELSIKPKEGSWVPTTPAQDKANASEFGMIAAKLQDAEILSTLAPKYGIDYSVDEFGANQRLASMRLEEYARVTNSIPQGIHLSHDELINVVLSNCAEWARPDALMDDNGAMRDFYKDWFSSDEGRNADLLLRMVIRNVYQLHGQGSAKQAQEVASIKMEAERPQREAAEQQAAEAEAKAAQAAEQGKKEQVMMAVGEKVLEQKANERQMTVEVAKEAALNQVRPPASDDGAA